MRMKILFLSDPLKGNLRYTESLKILRFEYFFEDLNIFYLNLNSWKLNEFQNLDEIKKELGKVKGKITEF